MWAMKFFTWFYNHINGWLEKLQIFILSLPFYPKFDFSRFGLRWLKFGMDCYTSLQPFALSPFFFELTDCHDTAAFNVTEGKEIVLGVSTALRDVLLVDVDHGHLGIDELLEAFYLLHGEPAAELGPLRHGENLGSEEWCADEFEPWIGEHLEEGGESFADEETNPEICVDDDAQWMWVILCGRHKVAGVRFHIPAGCRPRIFRRCGT